MKKDVVPKVGTFSPTTDRWIILLLAMGTVSLAYLFPLLYLNFSLSSLSRDWSYFNALSLVLRSSIWSYGVFPLHNPWVCGGLDYVANPQTRVFSPMVIFDLLFSPNIANLFSLITYGFFGFISAVYLFRDFRVSQKTSYLGAFLFINCSWFSFHYTAGHITFGSFQLLPLVLFCAHKIEKPARFSGLMGLLALFLLDGAIYTFIFSILMIVSAILVGICRPHTLFSNKEGRKTYLLAILAASCLSAAKVIPLLVTFSNRRPSIGLFPMTLEQTFFMLMNPFHAPILRIEGFRFSAHEYACYFSVLSLLVILHRLRNRDYLRKNAPVLLLFLFWMWVAAGWGNVYNPWYLFQKVPLVNNAHIQSRTFIVAFLFFTLLLTRCLDASKRKGRFGSALAAILILEAIFVHSYPLAQAYRSSREPNLSALLTHRTIESTVAYGYDLSHYYSENASKKCYEPAFLGTQVSAVDDFFYQGQIYLLDGNAKVSLAEQSPGRLIVQFDRREGEAPPPKETKVLAEINTNYLSGWKVDEGPGFVLRTTKNLVGVETTTLPARITLKYAPPYLPYVFGFFGSGLLFAFLLLFRFFHLRMRKQ